MSGPGSIAVERERSLQAPQTVPADLPHSDVGAPLAPSHHLTESGALAEEELGVLGLWVVNGQDVYVVDTHEDATGTVDVLQVLNDVQILSAGELGLELVHTCHGSSECTCCPWHLALSLGHPTSFREDPSGHR